MASLQIFTYNLIYDFMSKFLGKPCYYGLLKIDHAAFANQFADYCGWIGEFVKPFDCSRSFSDVLRERVRDFLDEYWTRFAEEGHDGGDLMQRDPNLRVHLGDTVRTELCADSGCVDVLCHRFRDFCISRWPPLDRSFLCRVGKDAKHESDEALAKKIYDYGKYVCKSHPLQDSSVGVHDVKVDLIDFDLVGVDRRHFPLRMYLWERGGDCGWFAHVYDRETRVRIAEADGNTGVGTTEIRVLLPEEYLDERYKPHGDIPRLESISVFDEEDSIDAANWAFNGRRNVSGDDDPKDRFRKTTPELVKSWKDLFCASLLGARVVYTGQSEFERLIPVAASLRTLYSVPSVVFDFNVRRYQLQPSSVRDAMLRDSREMGVWCKRFVGIFKGTRWEKLPEDLVMRIVSFLPKHRHVYRSDAHSTTS
ncbi:hypothetical protein CBR_g11089 [Chara braunii]|uniref:Uncharacterized protein n=1 Tax=Chara braunii TaxID=69332 RepID=A0A388KQ35_CHABU|nr:hypothetical protein CBR_g11089 [Chara braunii]|eukprot:GBG72156.1 hypothetical protein CBR_g11089 [Chara braunii]